jgi:hypothetical protein
MSEPCCPPSNVEAANPNTTSFDNHTVTSVKEGANLVGAVNGFYEAAALGKVRPNAPPLFSSYQQMMSWKQAQNRR